MNAIECLRKNAVEFNVLCVLSRANVAQPRQLYAFFRSLGIDYIQYIPLAEFDGLGQPCRSPLRPRSMAGSFARRSTCGGRTAGACTSAISRTSPKPWPAAAGHMHHARNLRQLCGGGVQRRRLPVRFFRGARMEAGQRQSGFMPEIARPNEGASSPPTRPFRIPRAKSASINRSVTAAVPSTAMTAIANSAT